MMYLVNETHGIDSYMQFLVVHCTLRGEDVLIE